MKSLKPIIVLSLMTLFVCANCLSQKLHPVRSTAPIKIGRPTVIRTNCGPRTLDPKNAPLYVINNFIISQMSEGSFNFLNPDNFKNVSVYQKTDSIAKSYGEKGKNGVITVEYKAGTKILTLPEILDHFRIDECDRDLKICINSSLFEASEALIFDPTALFDITVITGKYTIKGTQINAAQRFINITTCLP